MKTPNGSTEPANSHSPPNRRIPVLSRSWLGGLVVVAAAVLAACSTTEPPTNRVALADLGVRAAAEARAAEFAPAELQSARDKLAKAKQAMSAQDYEEARRLAESAQIDAELAQAKAETAIMRRAADQISRKSEAPPTKAELESRQPLTESPAKE